MAAILIGNWWALALRGLLAILFGLVALVWPGLTLVALVLLFGAYALVDGLFAFAAGLWAARAEQRWWPFLLVGILGTLTGVVAVAQPAAVAFAFVFLIGAWAILTGALEIAAAVSLRKELSNEWLLGLGGLASVVFGVLVTASPAAGALTLVLLFGIYAILYGAMLLGLGFRLRALHQRLSPPEEARALA
jgi:uncharacterized membrane protein HdeD (DUF308 family)